MILGFKLFLENDNRGPSPVIATIQNLKKRISTSAPKPGLITRIKQKIGKKLGMVPKKNPFKIRHPDLNSAVSQSVNRDIAKKKSDNDFMVNLRSKFDEIDKQRQKNVTKMTKIQKSEKFQKKRRSFIEKLPRNMKREKKAQIIANVKGIRDAVRRLDNTQLTAMHTKHKGKPTALAYSTRLELKARSMKKKREAAKLQKALSN